MKERKKNKSEGRKINTDNFYCVLKWTRTGRVSGGTAGFRRVVFKWVGFSGGFMSVI